MSSLPELLTRADHDPSWLTRAHQRGVIAPSLPGVFLRADIATDAVWRARAAMLWRKDAVICGELAAQLTFWRELEVNEVDIAARTTIAREGFRFHDRRIPGALTIRYGALTVTLPALTALDLAVARGPEAIDRVLRSRLARIEDLHAALMATPSRHGNRDRRRLLLESRAEPWSAAERIAHQLFRHAGIKGWRANAPVTLDGFPYFIDIAFATLRLAIEIDGREFHTDPEVFESDRERQNSLQLARWVVLRFTYRQLIERPEYVVDSTRRGLRLARRLQQSRGQTA